MRRLVLALVFAALAVGCGSRERPATRAEVTIGDPHTAFAEAYILFQRGDFEHALPLFTALAASYPPLADYELYYAGIALIRLTRGAQAEEVLTRLLRDYPQSVLAPRAQLELGQLLARSGRLEGARGLLQQALAAPDSATALEARLALADLDASSGDAAAAYAGFMTVRRRAGGSALGRTAKQRLLALRAQHLELVPAGADRLDEARLLVSERDYAAAESMATDMIEHPVGMEVANAMRVRADALYGEGKIEAALAALREVADDYPESSAAPAASFRLASILWNRDQDAAALPAFAELSRRYAAEPQAAEALYAIGRIHQQAGRDALAIDAFAELARRYSQSPLAVEARWRIGWIHYLAGDGRHAVAVFSQLAARTQGRERAAATYWHARALEREGRPAAARAVYQSLLDEEPSDYYSMWARQRLGAALLDVGSPVGAIGTRLAPVEPVAAGPAPPADTFHIPRAGELQAAGLDELARHELAAAERAHRDDPDTVRYLVRAYPGVGGYAAAVRLVRQLDARAGLSESERERVLYPLAFWADVRREAESQAVDPLLVLAVMRQESLFDPEARSVANARGLMQLLPATAQRLDSVSPDPLADGALTRPERNIQLGVRYLRGLLDHFQGDTLKALAAYNAGESAVEKWQRQFAHLEADEFVECITFRETRDYVKRVVANVQKYRELYTGG